MTDGIYETKERVFRFLKKHQMVRDGGHVLAAVSGGADSVCLLLLLCSLRDRLSIRLSAAHVNHNLRENAGRDEAFVRSLCERLAVPLYFASKDVGGFSAEKKLGLEEAARLCRYEALQAMAKEADADRIAVAHHKEDQAETLLFSLCRGTGIDGMAGMRPVSGNLIRPLLCLEKEQILSCLKAIGQDYVTDETNADNAYSRNLIRNEVLPLLSEKINANTVSHMAAAAERMRDLSDYLSDLVKEGLSEVMIENSVQRLSVEKLKTYPEFLQKEILRAAVYEAAGKKKDITSAHIEAVFSLLDKQSGKGVMLPYDVEAVRSFGELMLVSSHAPMPEADRKLSGDDQKLSGADREPEDGKPAVTCKAELTKEELQSLENGTPLTLERADSAISLRIIDPPPAKDLAERIPQKAYTKWLDYDRIEKPVSIRCVNKADWFCFDGMHKKSATAYFRDQKLSKCEQSRILVLASGDEIHTFLPGRISQAVKVTKDTKRILEITRTMGSQS